MSGFRYQKITNSLNASMQSVSAFVGSCHGFHSALNGILEGWNAYMLTEPSNEERDATAAELKAEVESRTAESLQKVTWGIDKLATIRGTTRAAILTAMNNMPTEES